MRKRDSQLEPERRRPLLGVWQGIDSVAHFNKIKARFFSEYGFQSFPEYQSVLKYAPEERDHNIYSDVMMAHQRGGQVANSRIEKITADEYRKPKDFPSTLYMSILLQGDAIKTAIEAHRRMMPYNMEAFSGSITTVGLSPPGRAATITGAGRPSTILRGKRSRTS